MHFELVRPEEEVQLPVRATANSAGYDFFSPADYIIEPHGKVKIPTNVTVALDNADTMRWVLQAYPRSSMAIKRGMAIVNTVGIIDADYCGFEIAIFLENRSEEPLVIKAGDRFCQGIFVPYLITSDDAAFGERVGGFGSTGN